MRAPWSGPGAHRLCTPRLGCNRLHDLCLHRSGPALAQAAERHDEQRGTVMGQEEVRVGARYRAIRGQHRGVLVDVIGVGEAHVRFILARKHRRTDSGRWHKLRIATFRHEFRPA